MLQYRSTGVTLCRFVNDDRIQLNLFDPPLHIEKYARYYRAVDTLRTRYGKHTVSLGSSVHEHKHAQHVGERGDVPKRKEFLFKGETKRKRLGIPLIGKVE